MKLSRLILSIMMLLGFSSYAGACLINLGDGAFYYTGLTITQHQNLIKNYLSQAWPALNMSSTSLGSEANAGLRDAVYNVPSLKNLKTADLGSIGSHMLGQGNQNNPAPVPEPATMLLLGTGLSMLVVSFKKLQWLP